MIGFLLKCRIIDMGRTLAIIFSLLFLLTSCLTRSGEEIFTDEERMEALSILANDMIEGAEAEGEIGEEMFQSVLPSSFTVYREYSPIYSRLESGYTSVLSDLISPYLDEVYLLLEECIGEAVSGGDIDSMVNAPEGMTDRIQDLMALEIYSFLQERIEEIVPESEQAFEEAYGIFISIRRAYTNLATIGVSIPLPEPKPLTVSEMAFAAEAEIFTRLGENERRLKSMIPESPESPYAVFWEDTL